MIIRWRSKRAPPTCGSGRPFLECDVTNSRLKGPIAFLGGGQMAEALIGGLLAAQVGEAASIYATDPIVARRDLLKSSFGIQVGSDNRDSVREADLVVLAVKPQAMQAVLDDVGKALAGKLVLSIAAGVLAAVRALFKAVGSVGSVEERLMDAVTGLSGSGPAYVFVAIEALADGGVKMGLPRRTAELLAAQTVLGAARLVLELGEHPARLKDQVASPGGTTIAGLHQLEMGGMRSCLMAAVEAATNRSQELGR